VPQHRPAPSTHTASKQSCMCPTATQAPQGPHQYQAFQPSEYQPDISRGVPSRKGDGVGFKAKALACRLQGRYPKPRSSAALQLLAHSRSLVHKVGRSSQRCLTCISVSTNHGCSQPDKSCCNKAPAGTSLLHRCLPHNLTRLPHAACTHVPTGSRTARLRSSAATVATCLKAPAG